MQSDTWWQLRAGKDMWFSRTVLLTDIYSHTAYGSFWLNHEWLAEVIFFALYRSGGFALLTIFCAALIGGGWLCSWSLTRGPSRAAFVLTVLALASAAGWWEPRPHAFSLLFIPVMVFLLYREKAGWLPVLFLVWANCHGGVLLGMVLLAAALAARTLVRPSLWRQSLVVLLSCAAAMTVTPLGLHFWTGIPRSLSRISQYTLDEWSRPKLSELALLPFWGIAVVYVVALCRKIRRLRDMTVSEATLHAPAVILLASALSAVRSVGPFLMIAVPALTHLWALRSPAPATTVVPRQDRPVFNLVVMAAGAFAVVATLSAAYREQWPRLKWSPVPEDAVEALQHCPGNLYNRYDEGGMLLWFAPGRRVFMDGRQDPFPPDLVLEHIEMETSKRDYKSTFERYRIDCAFLPNLSPVAARLMATGWLPLYQGADWVVLRKARRD
ncbi:MAG: hypothetical protein ABIS06_16325 [Vicinamibacterales bacterium]